MKKLWIALSLLAALAAWSLAPAGSALASNRIATQTGLACTVCHDKPGSKLLTDRGKYYELMGDLEGFDQIALAYGKCTTCHVKKAGSKKLTAEGKRLARAIENMDALRELVLKEHPTLPPAESVGPAEHRASDSGTAGQIPPDVILVPAH